MSETDSTVPAGFRQIRKTVCIDLDATLADYDRWRGVEHIGNPIPGAVEFVKAIQDFADVVIHTTRTSVLANPGYEPDCLCERVDDWLRIHGFATKVYRGDGKPLAVAYVDDRAVICRPTRDDQYDYDRALAEVRALCLGAPLGGQGTYSDGKKGEDDEGDLRFQVAHSGDDVRIDFGKPVAWLGFPKDQAIQFAMLILKHAGVQIRCQR